jgi:hypothetical protein
VKIGILRNDYRLPLVSRLGISVSSARDIPSSLT